MKGGRKKQFVCSYLWCFKWVTASEYIFIICVIVGIRIFRITGWVRWSILFCRSTHIIHQSFNPNPGMNFIQYQNTWIWLIIVLLAIIINPLLWNMKQSFSDYIQIVSINLTIQKICYFVSFICSLFPAMP